MRYRDKGEAIIAMDEKAELARRAREAGEMRRANERARLEEERINARLNPL